MTIHSGAGSYRTSWRSNPAAIHHPADFTAVCWFVVAGLSLTVLLCSLGYAESIGQALASYG